MLNLARIPTIRGDTQLINLAHFVRAYVYNSSTQYIALVMNEKDEHLHDNVRVETTLTMGQFEILLTSR